MNIAFVSLGFKPLRLSGLDLSGERLVAGLLDEGHTVTVIAGQREAIDEEVEHPNLSIHRIQLDTSDWIGFSRTAGYLLNQENSFDVIHFWDVHFGYACRQPFVASIQHSFSQRLSSVSFTRDRFGYIKNWGYYQIARRYGESPAVKKALGLLAGSETTKMEFAGQYPEAKEKMVIARHGIDVDFFSPAGDVSELRSTLAIPDDRPILVFAGFITPRKGIEYLFQALPQVSPEPILILAGRWRSEAYRGEIYGKYRPSDIQIIEPGFIPDNEMPALYTLADVYVSSSLMEGFGLPLAESLACETPVVAARAGSVAEVVGPGGIIVKPENPAALAEGINTLLSNRETLKNHGRAGRAHIEANFTVEKMVADTLDAYQRFS